MAAVALFYLFFFPLGGCMQFWEKKMQAEIFLNLAVSMLHLSFIFAFNIPLCTIKYFLNFVFFWCNLCFFLHLFFFFDVRIFVLDGAPKVL